MLIIDGYNLLFAQEGPPSDTRKLEGMRAKLIERIRAYCQKKKCKAKIYFDAKTMIMIANQRKATYGPVELIYTRESADPAIKESIKSLNCLNILPPSKRFGSV